MRKNYIKAAALIFAVSLCFSGCGKDGGDAGKVTISEVPVSVSGDEKKEEPVTSTETGKGDTGVSVSEPENEPETVTKTDREILMGFVSYDINCTNSLLESNEEMNMNDVVLQYRDIASKQYESELSVYNLQYGFIDCGGDGNEELVLKIALEPTDPDTGMGDVNEYLFFRYDGENVTLFYEESDFYRQSLSIFDSGYLVLGGSSSASSFDCECSVLSADGKATFVCSVTDSYVEGEPYISFFDISEEIRPENYPMFEWETGYIFPDDAIDGYYVVTTLRFTDFTLLANDEYEYEHAKLDNLFFVSDEAGCDIDIPENYVNYYAAYGIEIHKASEYRDYMVKRLTELGIGEWAIDGLYIEWTTLSLG